MNSARIWLRTSLALLSAFAAQLPAQTVRYRIEMVMTSRTDLSAFTNRINDAAMRPPAQNVRTDTIISLLTVSRRDSAGGVRFHMVVDTTVSQLLDRSQASTLEMLGKTPPKGPQFMDLLVLPRKTIPLGTSDTLGTSFAALGNALPLFAILRMTTGTGMTDTVTTDTVMTVKEITSKLHAVGITASKQVSADSASINMSGSNSVTTTSSVPDDPQMKMLFTTTREGWVIFDKDGIPLRGQLEGKNTMNAAREGMGDVPSGQTLMIRVNRVP